MDMKSYLESSGGFCQRIEMREKGRKFHDKQQHEWWGGGEFSLPLLKINCLFLSLIFGSAVLVFPTPHHHAQPLFSLQALLFYLWSPDQLQRF